MTAPFDLAGRTALVTGAGAADGIGFASALPQYIPKYTRGAYDPTLRGEVNA